MADDQVYNYITDLISGQITIDVLSSWIIEKMDNYNNSMYYENPNYIYECYKEGKIL